MSRATADVPLNWALIFGRAGMPALGVEGAAIASLLGYYAFALPLAYLLGFVYARGLPGLWGARCPSGSPWWRSLCWPG